MRCEHEIPLKLSERVAMPPFEISGFFEAISDAHWQVPDAEKETVDEEYVHHEISDSLPASTKPYHSAKASDFQVLKIDEVCDK